MKKTVDADQVKFGRAEALELARAVRKVVATRGRNVVTIDVAEDRPDDAALLAVLLGPTGNLRAPTLRMGKTLLVGFSAEAYATFA